MTCDCSLLESLFTTMIRRLIVYPKKKRPKSAAASSLQKFWISWQLDNRVYDKPFFMFRLTIIKKEIWNERERMKFYNFSWVRYIYHFIIQFWVTDDMQNAEVLKNIDVREFESTRGNSKNISEPSFATFWTIVRVFSSK